MAPWRSVQPFGGHAEGRELLSLLQLHWASEEGSLLCCQVRAVPQRCSPAGA